MAEKSTYQSLTDDIIIDANIDGQFSGISPEQFKSWILRAQEAITSRVKIPERSMITLVSGKTDYRFRDSTPITSVNGSSPNVVTSVSHRLITGETITISGSSIVTNLNGTWSVTVITEDTFSLDDSSIDTASYDGSAVFVSTSDIPTLIGDIYAVKRSTSGYYMDAQIVDMTYLLNAQHNDSLYTKIFSDIDSPTMCAMDYVDGTRTLVFYQAPISTNSLVEIYGYKKVIPGNRMSDAITAQIDLSSDYNDAIRHYVSWKAYDWAHMKELAIEQMQLFDNEIERILLNKPTHSKLKVIYQ